MIRRSIVLITVLAAVLSGCSDAGSRGPDAKQDATAWAEQVCQSLREGGTALAQLPQLDPRKPAKAKAGVVTYLQTLRKALGTMEKDLRAAGTPPVADGGAAYTKALGTLKDISDAVDSAVTRLRKAKVDDKAGLQKALARAGKDMAKVRQVGGPAADLKSNPELGEVFATAPTCKGIQA